MKLEFHGHDERYIVEQSLMNLFPLEKPVYGTVEPGEDDWCRLTAAELPRHGGAALSGRHRRRGIHVPPLRHGL